MNGLYSKSLFLEDGFIKKITNGGCDLRLMKESSLARNVAEAKLCLAWVRSIEARLCLSRSRSLQSSKLGSAPLGLNTLGSAESEILPVLPSLNGERNSHGSYLQSHLDCLLTVNCST